MRNKEEKNAVPAAPAAQTIQYGTQLSATQGFHAADSLPRGPFQQLVHTGNWAQNSSKQIKKAPNQSAIFPELSIIHLPLAEWFVLIL